LDSLPDLIGIQCSRRANTGFAKALRQFKPALDYEES
jgi:hypothetical protein